MGLLTLVASKLLGRVFDVLSRAPHPVEKNEEIVVTDEMRARVFWLLRKYTSYCYLERMYRLYAGFIQSYKEYSRGQPRALDRFLHENMESLARYASDFERGLARLTKGDHGGYSDIQAGLWCGTFLDSPRFEFEKVRIPYLFSGQTRWAGRPPRHALVGRIGPPYPPIPSPEVVSSRDLVISTMRRVDATLRSSWTYPWILHSYFAPFSFPARLQPLPAEAGVVIQVGGAVPVSGIWLPIDIPNGCPAYLIGGHIAPNAAKPTPLAPDYKPRTYDDEPSPFTEPTSWALLWEDPRYEDGRIRAQDKCAQRE